MRAVEQAVILRGADAQTITDRTQGELAGPYWSPAEGTPVALHVPATSDAPILLSPSDGERITVVIEENAETTIVEHGSDGSYTVDLLLKDNAHVHYISATDATIAVRRFAKLSRDASIEWTDYAHGERVESAVTTLLAGEGADAQFRSVFLGSGSERYAINTSMIHVASRSTSNMLTRAVMLDQSSGNYEGLIRIAPEAKGCDAYQKAETLLLGDKAKMHATPNLEISNEDVRCSHGVSLGQIEGEKLFYFLSRGIGRQAALALIVEGFFTSILDRMGTDGDAAWASVRNRLRERR